MKITISKKDIIWNYAGTLFSMGMGYLLLPFLLLYFDDDTLGLWYIFMNLANVANLFVFGFSPSFARNIAYCWNGAEKLAAKGKYNKAVSDRFNPELFVVILKTCKTVYFIIAVTMLLCFVSIGTVYVRHVAGHLLSGAYYFAWFVFLAAVFLNLYFGYYVSLLSGIGRVAEKNKAQVLASIIRISMTALLLRGGMGFLGACLAYLAYGFVFRIICRCFFDRALKEAYGKIECGTKIDIQEIRNCFLTIWPNTWREGLVSVSDYLCTQAGTIVASFFLTLAQTGQFSLAVQLVTVVARLSRSFQIAHIPALQSAYISEDKEAGRKIHSMCIFVYCIVFWTGFAALLAVGLPVISIIKPGMELDAYVLTGIGISQFIIVFRNCYASYLSTTNRIEYWKGFIISGIVSVIGSVLLLYFLDMGVWGIIISSVFSELVYNAWKWPYQVHSELAFSFTDMLSIGYKNLITIILGRNDEGIRE
ncbi:MAG: hypothetical protein K2P50_16820 [Lachnospiraceae bacterium]|nr:hypothetical protein [Lachnospiraceae bacterium]